MSTSRLLDMSLDAIACSDCPAAHAAGGPTKCPFETSDVPAGELLFKKDEDASRAWIIKSGLVSVGSVDDDSINLFYPGDLVGLDCIVTSKRLSDGRAVTAARVCCIGKETLLGWLSERTDRLKLVIDGAMNDPAVVAKLDE